MYILQKNVKSYKIYAMGDIATGERGMYLPILMARLSSSLEVAMWRIKIIWRLPLKE
jgi:hypothetical protein